MFGKEVFLVNPTEDVNFKPKNCIVVISNHAKATEIGILSEFMGYLEELHLTKVWTFSKELVNEGHGDLFELVEETNRVHEINGINPRHWVSLGLFDKNIKPLDEVFGNWI